MSGKEAIFVCGFSFYFSLFEEEGGGMGRFFDDVECHMFTRKKKETTLFVCLFVFSVQRNQQK